MINPFRDEPWVMLPENHEFLYSCPALLTNGQKFVNADTASYELFAASEVGNDDWRGSMQRMPVAESRLSPVNAKAVAVLSIIGVITQRPVYRGVASYQALSASFSKLVDDEQVSHIVLDLDTVGGAWFGLIEFADLVYQARAKKPVLAIANSLAGGAGYWIGSQATKFYMAPGAMVGGIGMYEMHEDRSEAMKKAGVTRTLIASGKYKTEGDPSNPLSKAAIDHRKKSVDDRYAAFVGAVARGRGVSAQTVIERYGQGRMLTERDALKAGMVDAAITLNNLLKVLGHSAYPANSKNASVKRMLAIIGLGGSIVNP